jgi:flagellar protein FlaG
MDIRPTAGNTAQAAAPMAAEKPAPSAPAPAAPTQSADALKPAEPAPSAAQVSQAVKSINTVLQVRSQDLEFSVDPDSARTIVTVTDKNTHEVIRQMPSREVIEIAKALDHLQSLLIRQTA